MFCGNTRKLKVHVYYYSKTGLESNGKLDMTRKLTALGAAATVRSSTSTSGGGSRGSRGGLSIIGLHTFERHETAWNCKLGSKRL